MINFATLKGVTIPEGVVTQISSGGVVLWKLASGGGSGGGGSVVLEVQKITSNTYAGETTYTGEQFILLDIYPKTNGTVSITYGGLTKTITDTSGAAEPNAQQVFFGTFNGVSDSVATPNSGTLTIEGDFYAFGQGVFETSGKFTLGGTCQCVSSIKDWGASTEIPANAFKYIVPSEDDGSNNVPLITSLTIPGNIESIGDQAFLQQTSLTYFCMLATTPPIIGTGVFDSTSFLITVPKGCGAAYKAAENWSVYSDRITEAS